MDITDTQKRAFHEYWETNHNNKNQHYVDWFRVNFNINVTIKIASGRRTAKSPPQVALSNPVPSFVHGPSWFRVVTAAQQPFMPGFFPDVSLPPSSQGSSSVSPTQMLTGIDSPGRSVLMAKPSYPLDLEHPLSMEPICTKKLQGADQRLTPSPSVSTTTTNPPEASGENANSQINIRAELAEAQEIFNKQCGEREAARKAERAKWDHARAEERAVRSGWAAREDGWAAMEVEWAAREAEISDNHQAEMTARAAKILEAAEMRVSGQGLKALEDRVVGLEKELEEKRKAVKAMGRLLDEQEDLLMEVQDEKRQTEDKSRRMEDEVRKLEDDGWERRRKRLKLDVKN